MNNKIHTVYGKNTGMEIKAVVKTDEKRKTKYGGIQVRLFGHGEKSKLTPMIFHLTTIEAHAAGRAIQLIVAGKKDNRIFTHKYKRENEEIETKWIIEKWKSRDGAKEGFGFAIKRGSDGIPVPCPEDEFLLVGDFLKALAVEQSWETYLGAEAEGGAGGGQAGGSQQGKPSGNSGGQSGNQGSSRPAAPPQGKPQESSAGAEEYVEDYEPL